jgi:hypothetical protein
MQNTDGDYFCIHCSEPVELVEDRLVGDDRVVAVCDEHGVIYLFQPG